LDEIAIFSYHILKGPYQNLVRQQFSTPWSIIRKQFPLHLKLLRVY